MQNVHELVVILRLLAAGDRLRDEFQRGFQDQPGGLGAAQLQPQLHKIAVVMAQPGELLAYLTQGIVTQLRLDPAQTIIAPHGAAAVAVSKVGLPVLVIEIFAQGIAQRTLHGAIPGGGCGIHLHIPFMTAAVGT